MNKEKVVLTLENLRPGFFKSKSEKCKSCIHGETNAGTHHMRCKKKKAIIKVNDHGFKSGWCTWPIDFDRIWIDRCDSYCNEKQYDDLSIKEKKIIIQGLTMYAAEKSKAYFMDAMFKSSLRLQSEAEEYYEKVASLTTNVGYEKLFIINEQYDNLTEKQEEEINKFLIELSKVV